MSLSEKGDLKLFTRVTGLRWKDARWLEVGSPKINLSALLQAAREEASGAGNKIAAGLSEALAFAKGDASSATVRHVRAPSQGAGEPVAWPISVDGPHKITDQRAWLARQLMDSKNSDEEAFGIVAYHPAIRGARPANDRTKALEEALAKSKADADLCGEQWAKEIEHGNALRKMVAPMYAALRKAEQFIVNGVELGFIRMPDPGTPDPAHDTLPAIRAALTPSDQPVKGDEHG